MNRIDNLLTIQDENNHNSYETAPVWNLHFTFFQQKISQHTSSFEKKSVEFIMDEMKFRQEFHQHRSMTEKGNYS